MTTPEENAPTAVIQRPRSVLLIAVAFGLLTGLTELSIWIVNFFQGEFIQLGPQVVWED